MSADEKIKRVIYVTADEWKAYGFAAALEGRTRPDWIREACRTSFADKYEAEWERLRNTPEEG